MAWRDRETHCLRSDTVKQVIERDAGTVANRAVRPEVSFATAFDGAVVVQFDFS